MAALGICATAHAQDCGAADADIFRTARRSRAIVADYNRLHAIHRADLRRNEAFARRTNQKLDWRFDLAGVIAVRQTLGFEVCTNQGEWDANLSPFVAGALLSVDVYDWDMGVEAFVLQSTDVLNASYTDAQMLAAGDENTPSPDVANTQAGEYMSGLRLTRHEWASLVFGYIGSMPLENYPGDDGRVILTGAGDNVRDDRIYLGLASPYGGGSFDLLFEPGDVATDIVALRFDALPMPEHFGRGVVGASYIDDESQPVLDLGVDHAFDFLTVNLATEFNPIRLRSALARADVEGGPELVLHQGETAARLAVDFGAFGEVSYFNSRHLEEQTGQSDVWGVAFGGFARPDITILMSRIDLWFGVNRPDELARISDFVDHWQVGMRFHVRFGL